MSRPLVPCGFLVLDHIFVNLELQDCSGAGVGTSEVIAVANEKIPSQWSMMCIGKVAAVR